MVSLIYFNIDFHLIFLALPLFEVNIITHGTSELDQTFTLECSVKQLDGMPISYTVTWDKTDGISDLNGQLNSSIAGSMTTLSLMLSPVTFDHRGEYRCTVKYNTSSEHKLFHNYTLVVKSETSIIISILVCISLSTVPPLTVDISTDYNDTLYAGTPLTITCLLDLAAINSVSVPITVTNQWTRDNNLIATNARISESITNVSSTLYKAILRFYPLDNSTDNGEYRCSLYLNTTSLYIERSFFNATLGINIEGKPLVN